MRNVCAFPRALVLASLFLAPLAAQAQVAPDIRFPSFASVARFEAETDFIVREGIVEAGRVRTHNDDNRYGDTLAGIQRGGERGVALEDGVYRWRFRIGRMGDPAFLPSSPVWTLSVHNLTTGREVISRRIDASDLIAEGGWHDRFLVHSTSGQAGHRFEARVRWEARVNGIIDFVELERSTADVSANLEAKALELDRDLRARFLDPLPGVSAGQLVARKLGSGEADQRGDSFTWTAIYTATQALRLRARPSDEEALANMEQGFRTLTRMHEIAGLPGILPRYVDANGNWTYVDKCDGRWKSGRFDFDAATGVQHCQPAEAVCTPEGRAVCPSGKALYQEWEDDLLSEDIYTAFAFAVGQGFDLIGDPALKERVRTSMSAVAQALLDGDFRLTKPAAPGGRPALVDFNPYFPTDTLRETIVASLERNDSIVPQIKKIYAQYDELLKKYDAGFVGDVVRFLLGTACGVDFPNLNGLLPPVSDELFAAIEAKDADTIVRLLPPFLTALRGSLTRLNTALTQVSDLFWGAHRCIGRYPGNNPLNRYMFIAQFVDQEIRPTLLRLTNNLPVVIDRIEDLRVDPSNAIAAANILATASMVDGRFYQPYQLALGGSPKLLLDTMERWAGVDETVAQLSGGDKGADRSRADTNWKTFASLVNLATIEARRGIPELGDRYLSLLIQLLVATRDEGNVFYDAAKAYAGITFWSPIDTGLMGWTLATLPSTRVGMSKNDWLREIDRVREYSGELISWDAGAAFGFARDPIPASVRALNNLFLWQRNPRKLGATDYDQVATPGLDYLFAYWMARAGGVDLTVPGTGLRAPTRRPYPLRQNLPQR